jgi:hypothetical protein
VLLRLLNRVLTGGRYPELISLAGVPALPVSELPVLPGYTYPQARQVGPIQIPAFADPPVVAGVLLEGVARGEGMPVASIELLRLQPGLTGPELDGVVARLAFAMRGELTTSTYGGTPVHTVLGLAALWLRMSVVVFRRGDDVVLVFSPNADTAWEVAAAYLDATAG